MESTNKKESMEKQFSSLQNGSNNNNFVSFLSIYFDEGPQNNLNNRSFIYKAYLNDIETLNESEQIDDNTKKDNINSDFAEKNKSSIEEITNNSPTYKKIIDIHKKTYNTSLNKINKMHQNFETLYNESVLENKKFEENLKTKYLEFQKQLEEISKKNEKIFLDEIASLKNKLQEKDIIINSLKQSNNKLKEHLKKLENELINTKNLLLQYNKIIKKNDLLLFKLNNINFNNENNFSFRKYYSQLEAKYRINQICDFKKNNLIKSNNNKIDNTLKLIKDDNYSIPNTNNYQSLSHLNTSKSHSRLNNINSFLNIKNELIGVPKTSDPTKINNFCCNPYSDRKEKNQRTLNVGVNIKQNFTDTIYKKYILERNLRSKIVNENSNHNFGYKGKKSFDYIYKRNNFLSKIEDDNQKKVNSKNKAINPLKKENETKNNIYEHNISKSLFTNKNGKGINNVINFATNITFSQNTK